MTPFAIALTSHVILTLFLSLSLCLSIFILGFKFHGLAFLKIFIPECPFLLLFLLIPIEIFSYVIRSFSLAIRLSANIMAGHTLVYIVSSFIFNIIQIKFWFIIFSSFLFAILILELGIAFLQTYIFTILLCIYLSDAYNGGH